MMRKLILTAAALTVLTLGPASAQTYELDITAQLRAQGYQNISLSHTWLGRTRIVALLGSDLREIVLDPNTGEILRDLSRTVMADGGDSNGDRAPGAPGSAVVASSGAAAGATGSAVRTSAGIAAASALDGQVTPLATVGISTIAGSSPGGSAGVSTQPGSGALVDTSQTGLPFQILSPTGGQ